MTCWEASIGSAAMIRYGETASKNGSIGAAHMRGGQYQFDRPLFSQEVWWILGNAVALKSGLQNHLAELPSLNR